MITIKACLIATFTGFLCFGCAQHARNTLMAKDSDSEVVELSMPTWVEAPEWAKDELAQENVSSDNDTPSVSVVHRIIQWSGEDAIQPAILPNRHVFLSAAAAEHVIKSVHSIEAGSVLTSPRVMVANGQSAHIAMFTRGEEHDSGIVFFVKPKSISQGGAELQYSFQTGGEYKDGFKTNDLRFATLRLDGTAKLNIGQWYLRRFEDNPNGDRRALLIQIERVNFQDVDDGSFGG